MRAKLNWNVPTHHYCLMVIGTPAQIQQVSRIVPEYVRFHLEGDGNNTIVMDSSAPSSIGRMWLMYQDKSLPYPWCEAEDVLCG